MLLVSAMARNMMSAFWGYAFWLSQTIDNPEEFVFWIVYGQTSVSVHSVSLGLK
jgi:hypothetical protein